MLHVRSIGTIYVKEKNSDFRKKKGDSFSYKTDILHLQTYNLFTTIIIHFCYEKSLTFMITINYYSDHLKFSLCYMFI